MNEKQSRYPVKTSELVCVHCPKCDNTLAQYEIKRYQTYFLEGSHTHTCGSCQAKFLFKDGELIEVEENHPGSSSNNLTLLVLQPQDKPLYLIVRGTDYYDRQYALTPNCRARIVEHQEYLYGEHTCPDNILRDAFMLVHDGDPDEHGLFDYIKSIPLKDIEAKLGVKWSEVDYSNDHHHDLLTQLFPEVFT